MATTELTVEQGAEQVIDGIEEIAMATSAGINKGVLLVGGIAVGVSVGYLIAKRRLEKRYREMAEEEIELVRDLYFQKEKKAAMVREEKGDLEDLVKRERYGQVTSEDQRYTEAEQAAIDEANRQAAQVEEEAEPEIHRVFAGDVAEWDWDVEKERRRQLGNSEVPYVLHRDEYLQQESGYTQAALTYFEGDDVLADDQDTVIDDQDAMVGLGNLARFGQGSGDPNVVYVRNPELHIEYEIVHSDGKFSEQRRGIPVEPPRDEKGRFQPKPEDPPPSGDPRHRRSRGT